MRDVVALVLLLVWMFVVVPIAGLVVYRAGKRRQQEVLGNPAAFERNMRTGMILTVVLSLALMVAAYFLLSSPWPMEGALAIGLVLGLVGRHRARAAHQAPRRD